MRDSTFAIKTLLVALQVLFVLVLLTVWLSSDSIRESKNLWVLFFYCIPATFIICTVTPYGPVLLYFGKFHPALTVALVATASTVMTEAINYLVISYISDLRFMEKVQYNKFVMKLITLFEKMPFVALVTACFGPFPFYPFRFLVVLARYSVVKYLLAVFIARISRFYIVALFGYFVDIPDLLLIGILVVFIILMNYSFVKSLWEIRHLNKKKNPEE